MTVATIFDTYTPRSDVLRGEIAEVDFAADLASVVSVNDEKETVQVLRRRLFKRINEANIDDVVDAYRTVWSAHHESLSRESRQIRVK